MHKDRLYKNGAIGDAKSFYGRPLEERLLAKRFIDEKSGCWNWIGSKLKDGYGGLKIRKPKVQSIGVHRIAAHLWLGFDLHSKLFVCHICDNPPCFNPKHLFIGTSGDNKRDCQKKGRHAVGEKNGSAKLTKKEVLKMRDRYESGEIGRKLAKQYRISESTFYRTVSKNINRRSGWKHLDSI